MASESSLKSNLPETDLEASRGLSTIASHLNNDAVQSFSWKDVGVVVKDRQTKQPLSILSSAYGHVEAGQVLAIMGPSGCGKTTLLNVLANRVAAASAQVTGEVLVNNIQLSSGKLRKISSYVEQEDVFIGSLTVRENLDFTSRISLPSSVTKKERHNRVSDLLESFGIVSQANTLVGTPIRKGISGGQKRRLGVASQLVTCPKILFLDEPTSGLDSHASFEVMNYIKNVARSNNLIVIASIHQPSTTTFEIFDSLMLLSAGKTCYFGPSSTVAAYFSALSHEMPLYTNPAEFLLKIVNVDFAEDKAVALQELSAIHDAWNNSSEFETVKGKTHEKPSEENMTEKQILAGSELDGQSKMFLPLTLLHRNFIKSYRDIVAYGIRIAMYMGLAIMMGTVWLRLNNNQTSIQPFINAIFFGSAFMSFMAVAYVPACIEDLQMFKKERANGLYGPLPFVIANFLIGLPYLFGISIIFSLISYWLSNFRPTAGSFWTWVFWLFLDLLAAESLVVLVTSVAPIFVISLAVTAFANGLWMSVGGFLVPLDKLNVFWKYVFHYIDYQAYVFQGMMINQFSDTEWECATESSGGYNCMFPSDLQSQGKIRGEAILQAYNYHPGNFGKWVGIMFAIIVMYRVFGYIALRVQKH